MNKKFVIYAVGKLLIVLSAVMLIPAFISIYEYKDIALNQRFLKPGLYGFIIAIMTSFIIGFLMTYRKYDYSKRSGVREGFAIVTFGWIIGTFFGSIPLFTYLLNDLSYYSLTSVFGAFTNAYFENMSGFTTTGATILTDVEILPKGILFWRSMTHWLGGMGIVTLALAIFPAFGVTGYQMFRGEVPGPTTERLKPRLAQTAKILWGVYALLTLAETILLVFGGMTWFDSLCHAFGTMATGGFSTKNASVAAYSSAYIDWVIIVFMFLAGMNFMIHYRVLFSGKLSVLKKDPEFKFYFGIIIIAIVIGVGTLQISGLSEKDSVVRSFRNTPLTTEDLSAKYKIEYNKISTIPSTIRYVSFQVISLVTTTGFCTADFDIWPNTLRFLLVMLMFMGGSAGSTGGGIKMVRIMVVFKSILREIKTTIQPRLIAPVKISGTAVAEKQVRNIVAFFIQFIVLTAVFSGIMTLIIPDFTTAITSVIATICNIGPGLSGVGATENYAWIPTSGKWVLTICMLLGRLEIYTVIIALSPRSWRK